MSSSRPGDWNCRSCGHLNFQRRDSCQLCLVPKSMFSSSSSSGPDVRPGDWNCNANNCGTHNFASRSTCFSCGAPKDADSEFAHQINILRAGFGFAPTIARPAPGWKSGDWICIMCNEHNFANKTRCFRCNAPRTGNY